VKVGGLFSGIGGFELGFERAGFDIAWMVEIDPFCRAVLAKHWPQVNLYEDVRTVGAEQLAAVDVLCGGFPCQDISVAGNGAGIDGARSGLWRELDRLIGELRPRYVVVENVSALLVRGMGRVLGDLAARGYDAEWDCLPASAFGAPHRRDRVWIVAYSHQLQRARQPGAVVRGRQGRNGSSDGREDVAYANGRRCEVERIKEHGRESSTLRDQPDGCRAGRSGAGPTMVNANGKGRQYAGEGDAGPLVFREGQRIDPAIAGAGWWDAEPDVGRVAHGVPARVDRLRGLGNAIVPQIAQWIAERIKEAEAVSP